MESPVKILIVEDEMIIGANISLQLSKLGYEVTGIISKGEDALAHVEENNPDIHVFHPKVMNVKDYRLTIYSRWGEKLFESNDPYIGWDGYLNAASLAAEGVYVYKAWVRYLDGSEEILAGDLTFLH